MASYEVLMNAVLDLNEDKVVGLTQKLLDEGAEPLEVVNLGLIGGMNVVGEKFKNGEMFIPEVIGAANAMKKGMDILKPHIADQSNLSKGKIVLGTVANDLHDIGKNLVGMIMESTGLEVVDLGIDLPAEKFAEAVSEHKPEVLGISALLTTTMLEMKKIIEVLQQEGLRDQVKIIVGGAPITKEFAEEIGADGWAPDALSARDLVANLIG